MAASSLRNLALLLVVVVAGTLVCNNDIIVVTAQCGGSISDLILQCQQYVQKTGPQIPPSAACCTELRKFDVKCMCQYITQSVVNLISIPKAIYVANTCGLNLPHGSKCGDTYSLENLKIGQMKGQEGRDKGDSGCLRSIFMHFTSNLRDQKYNINIFVKPHIN